MEILRQLVLRRRGAATLGPITTIGAHEFRPVVSGYLSGYCLIAERATLQGLGGFDPALFWVEDVDLSARAHESGLALGVCTDVEVVHEQTSTRRRHVALVTFFQMTAKIGYARRHSPTSVGLVATVVAAVAAIRWVWFAAVRRGVPDAHHKARAYRAVMRRGWRLPAGWDPNAVDRLRRLADTTV
jgi:GT2 family glycosyltransferase